VIQFDYPFGSTPLDPDEAIDLFPSHIRNQADLNLWEEANITQAELWVNKRQRQFHMSTVLTEGFVRELHRRMFNRTWRWSGTFRKSNKNIGVDWTQISVKLNDLLLNTIYQLDHSADAIDEIATRFHHQLVWIHAFPNGNGRHARLMTDCLLMTKDMKRFSWGANYASISTDLLRTKYIDALRKADRSDYSELLSFVRA
jgi:Fic-DOC domain mobile mystery protein B